MTRRLALLLAAVVAVVTAAFAWVVLREDDSPAAATKRALAAVTVEVLDIEPTSYNVNPGYDRADPLGVEIRWKPDAERDSHYLRIGVDRGVSAEELGACSDYYECDTWEGADGTFFLRWQLGTPEEDPGILGLDYLVGDEARSVVYAGAFLDGDPRDQELPRTIEDFEDLLADQRFSTTTTTAMVETDLAKWPEDEHAGDPVPTTPEVIAQWAYEDGVAAAKDGIEPADVSGYADGSVGVEFHSPGRVTTVVLVPEDADEVPACEDGWHCRTKRGVTTGWRRGEAIAIRASDDAVVYASVRSEAIVDRLPKPAWRFDAVGRDFEALERGYSAMNLVTTREFASLDGQEWFD